MDDPVHLRWHKLEDAIEDVVAYLQRQQDDQARHLAAELQEEARKMDHTIRSVQGAE
jgi:hypothetical protein